jgi:hypothetical protein
MCNLYALEPYGKLFFARSIVDNGRQPFPVRCGNMNVALKSCNLRPKA